MKTNNTTYTAQVAKGNEGVNLKLAIVSTYDFFERFSPESPLKLPLLGRLEGFLH